MAESVSDMSGEVSDEEIAEFEQAKMSREVLVHRLRDWEVGDVVCGYDVVSDGASHGKTFKRGGEFGDTLAIEQAIDGVRNAPLLGETLDEDTTAFAWVGIIESTRTEGRNPADPGEPPMKTAKLKQVSVVAARNE